MMFAPIPQDESARQDELDSFGILDTLPEQAYDDLVFLAAHICGTPIASMTLIDKDRQWFKSKIGLQDDQTARDISFCGHTILDPSDLFIVSDASSDTRFADNPFVTGNPHIAFYAGAPLVSPNGHALGSICVIDRVARDLDDDQKKALLSLSRQIMAQLELRRSYSNLRDLAHKKDEMQRSLQRSQTLFTAFMDNNPADAFIKDTEGKMRYANASLLKRLGRDLDSLIGKTDAEIWPETAGKLVENDRQVLDAQKALRFEEHLPGPDGELLTCLTVKFPLTDPSGAQLIGGIGLDITERKFAEQQLEEYQTRLEEVVDQLAKLSSTDALSGLHNKRAFDQQLAESYKIARRKESPLSLILLDVDHFKKYNDTEGHPAGDEVLREVGAILRETVRPGDFAARYGGEEFVVILEDTSAEGAVALAERIRNAFHNRPWSRRAVTASLGAAVLLPAMEAGADLVKAADIALYRAKGEGRDRVALSEPSS